MIVPAFSNRQALGIAEQFTIYIIKLQNANGDYCGVIKYIRMRAPYQDTLNEAIYEAIKSRYPFSSINYQIGNTLQRKKIFKQYKRHKRLYIICRNCSLFDPAYFLSQTDRVISVMLDVYDAKKHFIYNECECYTRKSDQEIANACNEEYTNFATYREFFQ